VKKDQGVKVEAESGTGPEATPAKRGGPIRRLYDWVLSWADTPYGTAALAAISFAESSFFPIPPDVLQIALSVSRPKRAYYYALVNAVASVAGGVAGFYIGVAFWSSIGSFCHAYVPGLSKENFEHVQKLYQGQAFLAILAAAFTPIPYKVFTIAAGVFNVPLGTLIAASAVGRSARFFLVATAIHFFGPSVRVWLERNFEWATILLFAGIVGGFVAIKYVF
jgi:membrane protein YqaA with SNARE-associated domain